MSNPEPSTFVRFDRSYFQLRAEGGPEPTYDRPYADPQLTICKFTGHQGPRRNITIYNHVLSIHDKAIGDPSGTPEGLPRTTEDPPINTLWEERVSR